MKKLELPPRESYLKDIRESKALSEKEKEAVFRAEESSLKYPLSLEEARALQAKRKAELAELQKNSK